MVRAVFCMVVSVGWAFDRGNCASICASCVLMGQNPASSNTAHHWPGRSGARVVRFTFHEVLTANRVVPRVEPERAEILQFINSIGFRAKRLWHAGRERSAFGHLPLSFGLLFREVATPRDRADLGNCRDREIRRARSTRLFRFVHRALQRERAAASEHQGCLGHQPEQRIFPAAALVGVTPADRPFDPDHHA